MKNKWLTCGLFVVSVFATGLGSRATAVGIDVSVGYADSLRPNAFFPNPWAGSPNVIFVGDPDGGYDAGAVMITNNTASAITINDLTVSMPWNGNQWDLWGINVIPVGKSLVLTQTNGENFDTSDYPTLSYPQTYADGETAHASAVVLTVDGVVQSTLLDTGHVLTTGGSDPGGSGVNESFQWRPIGTFGGPAGVPEPSSIVMAASAAAGGIGFGWRRRRMRRSTT